MFGLLIDAGRRWRCWAPACRHRAGCYAADRALRPSPSAARWNCRKRRRPAGKPAFSGEMVFPTGSASPKYFRAIALREDHGFRAAPERCADRPTPAAARMTCRKFGSTTRDTFREVPVADGHRHAFRGQTGRGAHFGNLVAHRNRQRHGGLRPVTRSARPGG